LPKIEGKIRRTKNSIYETGDYAGFFQRLVGQKIKIRDKKSPCRHRCELVVETSIEKQTFELLRTVLPDLEERLDERYLVLRAVNFLQPIGRRTLSDYLSTGERIVRSIVEVLKEQHLVEVTPLGIVTTEKGKDTLWKLKEYIEKIKGIEKLEKQIAGKYQLQKAVVVAGDADKDLGVKQEMCTAAAEILLEVLKPGNILAVSGGTTMAMVADSMDALTKSIDITVVPARGGLGEDVEKQANTVAAKLAKALGGSYRLLHVPDVLEEELLKPLLSSTPISDVIDLIKRADVLLHGIGTAEEMAQRRGLHPELWQSIVDKGAVGEAFGYYFDSSGRIVHTTPSAGLRLEDLANIKVCIAVGGGMSKAEAIEAFLKVASVDIVVTDEAVARELAQDN